MSDMQSLINFFGASGFIPHGYCLTWSSWLLWLHVLSDALIVLAYYSIPLSLVYFIRQRKDLPYPWLFALFGLFIVACGTTHLFSIITVWIPLYWLDGMVKAVTAAISVVAALLMFRVIPRALMLRSPAQLEVELRERKQNELELRKFKAIIESTDDAIISKSLTGIIESWNHGAEKMFGYTAKEAIGRPMTMLIPPDRLKEETDILSRISRGEQIDHFETVRCRKDGRLLDISTTISPILDEDGNVIGASKIARDITARKQAEEKIKELNQNLELRVTERTAQLEASGKDMEDFNYNISHDLRAPLRAINGFSKILQEEYVDRLDDEGRRQLSVICDNAQKMGELIDGLLAFSRIGRVETECSTINMQNLVTDVWEELKPDMTVRNVHLELRDLPPAEGDATMMHQVVFNLLSNAVKFTKHNADTRIEVGGQTGERETIYHVKDNGVGFNMQYADKLFGVFLRLHGMDEFEGTGIGLAIVKRIIAKHGGRVWAEGQPNEGATIYFALPAMKKS
jgi:PAS domain S-box-containing protein